VKAGIFVHSISGNTSQLALAVTHALREKGVDVSVELLRPLGKWSIFSRKIALRNDIDITEYNIVLVAGPILGLSPSPVVMSFIKSLDSLKGKKALSFSTSILPAALSNAKSVHKRIKTVLEDRGATVLKSTSLAWGFYCGKKRIDAAVEEICGTVLG
jgi:menaquinone-dependent protoporphyrinogen IX oxidase